MGGKSAADLLWAGVLTREEFDELLNLYGRAVWNVAYEQGRGKAWQEGFDAAMDFVS